MDGWMHVVIPLLHRPSAYRKGKSVGNFSIGLDSVRSSVGPRPARGGPGAVLTVNSNFFI